MADIGPAKPDVDRPSGVLDWPPRGVSDADVVFLTRLWKDLRAKDQDGDLTPNDIHIEIASALRKRNDVAVTDAEDTTKAAEYARTLESVRTRTRARVKEQTDPHWVFLTQTPPSAKWRIYLAPMPGRTDSLYNGLYRRLRPNFHNLGIKFASSYKALCAYRDGWVIYANDEGRRAALAAISEEAKVKHRRPSGSVVRFAHIAADGVAALAPDPMSRANDWAAMAHLWQENHANWLRNRQLTWNQHNCTWMTYTQLTAAALTSCYVLANYPSASLEVDEPDVDLGTVDDAIVPARFRENVVMAFNDLGISDLGVDANRPSVGTPTVKGVGWLRFLLFD